jgi:hypothetical protein
MGYVGIVVALFTLGYIVGVWTALLVVRQPQRAYEEAVLNSDAPLIVLHRTTVTAARSSRDARASVRRL